MAAPALTALNLSHFRSYQQLTLEFDGRPVALFGDNGAGKTNLLEAISLLSPGRGLRRVRAPDLARSPQNIGWQARFDLTTPTAPHEIVTGLEDMGTSRRITIDGKAASQTALAGLVRVLWLVPVMDRLWLDGAAERRNFLDRITMSFTPEHARHVLAYEKSMRERNRLLRDQVADPAWYGALESQMAHHGAAIAAGRQVAVDRLAAAQLDAPTRFPKARLSIEPGDGQAGLGSARDLALAFADGRTRDLAAGRTLAGPHRSDLAADYQEKDMAARLCSTGEQKALLVSLILANARALAKDTGAPPILLLDEVAAHLDAGRRADLFEEITELGSQAFLTGTGPELFDALGDRASLLSVSEGPDGSRVSPA